MVFDPVAVVGFVGTTAGLVSFLTSTLENLHGRARNHRECARRLEDYKNELETNLLELQDWLRTWSRHCQGENRPFPEATYEYFWGQEGFEGVQCRLRRIREEARSVVELLKCRDIHNVPIDWMSFDPTWSRPSRFEILQWISLLEDDEIIRGRSRHQHATWMYKFFFALYKNTEIQGRLEGLAKKIDELERHSRLRFCELHDNRRHTTMPQDLQRLATLQTERENLVAFLNDLYYVHRNASMRWDLILGDPELADALQRLENASRMQLNFGFLANVLDDTMPLATGPRHFRVTYPRDCNLRGGTLLEQVQRWNQVQIFLFTFRQRRLAQHHRIDILGLDELTAYMLAALSAVRSSILLYGSPWVYGLCLCGIQVHESHNLKAAAIYYADEECSHVHPEFRGRTFLLLGLLLAELAVGAPITISLSPSNSQENDSHAEPFFNLPQRLLTPGLTNPLSCFDLANLVGESAADSTEQYVSVKYFNAMEYCFELSQRLLRRQFCADDMEMCLKKIVKPLEEQYAVLTERKKELSSRKWYCRSAVADTGPARTNTVAELE